MWNTLRLKPPPLDDDKMGWRVEFRPMDVKTFNLFYIKKKTSFFHLRFK